MRCTELRKVTHERHLADKSYTACMKQKELSARVHNDDAATGGRNHERPSRRLVLFLWLAGYALIFVGASMLVLGLIQNGALAIIAGGVFSALGVVLAVLGYAYAMARAFLDALSRIPDKGTDDSCRA